MTITINEKDLPLLPLQEGWNHSLDQATLDRLRQLPLEKQVECYSVAQTTSFQQFSYGELDSQRQFGSTIPVHKCYELLGLIVDDGVVVGIHVNAWYNYPRPLFVGQCVCVYSVCDEDGTGRDEREDYITLLLD